MRLAFREFVSKYVSRNCNNVVHVLAKQVTDTHQSEVWYVTPTYVYDLILYEASAKKKPYANRFDLGGEFITDNFPYAR